MFSSIWEKLKEMIKSMLGPKTIEQALHVTPTISSKMANAIELWTMMYEGEAPWLREPTRDNPTRIVSLGLPSLIASEKARMVTLEMESEITVPTEDVDKINENFEKPGLREDGTISMGRGKMIDTEPRPLSNPERAEFLNDQYKKLKRQIRRQLEYGIAKGGLVIKPYVVLHEGEVEETLGNNEVFDSENPDKKKLTTAEIEFDYVQADGFYPLSFDANGKVVEAAFVQRKIDKDTVYSRLEYHKLENRKVTVINKAYKTYNNAQTDINNPLAADLGTEIPLSEVSDWKYLSPKTEIAGVDRLLFAYFRMPEANTIDTHSPLGVSGFSRVTNLIKDADIQYSNLLWEFEGGQLAIDVDRDALKLTTDKDGNDTTVRPIAQERLFRKVDLNAEDTYKVFSPQLRDASIIHGLNTILTRIEDATGLSRGTISENQMTGSDPKTATELKILKQRSFATNRDIQMALEDAMRDTVYVMDVYCSLYNVTPEGQYEISFEWDDSILVDIESELSKRITLMQNGLASKVETRMWYFGETENQAEAALQKINDEQKMAMENNMMAQMELGSVAQSTPDLNKPENENDSQKGSLNNRNKNKPTPDNELTIGKE